MAASRRIFLANSTVPTFKEAKIVCGISKETVSVFMGFYLYSVFNIKWLLVRVYG